jgi:hypothetical protein
MKTVIKMLLVVGMISCLFLGNAQAVTYTYTDDYANWPGYPQAPYPVNPNDQIGTFPTISGAGITITNGYLESITIDLTSLRGTETLFINTSWIPGQENYDQWNYLVSAGADLYAVSPTFTPADYVLVDPSGVNHWRTGHPYTIIGSDLSLIGGITRITGGTTLTYLFQPNTIAMGDKFVFGMSEDCGNDVFLTPVTTPEPLSLLFLGAGLLGVVGIKRKIRNAS